MNWLTTFYLFFGVFLTGAITIALKSKIQPLLKSITSIGVAFVLGLLCLHILPEVFHQETSVRIGMFVLIGFIIQLFLELLSKGIEHGHVHHEHHNHSQHDHSTPSTFLKSNTKFFALILGLSIHSLIEGIPLFGSFTEAAHQHHGHVHEVAPDNFSWIFFWSILAHKLPVAIVLTLFMLDNHFSKFKALLYISIFALMTPLGGIIGHYADHSGWINLQMYLLAITSGMLLHITTLLIFEDYHHTKDKITNLLLISFGIGLSLILF